MAGVFLDTVSKTYPGGVNAVRGVSFAVPDGGFCVLVGPSGCGKSTLLRMIAGLEAISDGKVSIGGRVVNALEPAARDIAMVFQNYALYPHMSVYDNMAYGLRNLKTPEPEIVARVGEAARILELSDDMLKRKPRQLSGGQRQRVAMGRAIVRKPAVFLFDEPLSNLDAKLRVQMRIEIRKLQRRLGVTAIYVTHDQLEAMTLADMLVVMNAGRIEQIGAPLELYERPASVFVAGFLGSPPMNFLKGRVEAQGLVRLSSGAALAYDARHFGPPLGLDIIAGVRPERARLASADDVLDDGVALDDGAVLPFRVELVEELGLGRLVHGEAAGAAFALASPTGAALAPGAEQRLAIAAGDVHLFEARTGARL